MQWPAKKATLRLKSDKGGDKGGETITNCTKGTTTLPCTTWTASAWAQGQALAVDTKSDQSHILKELQICIS